MSTNYKWEELRKTGLGYLAMIGGGNKTAAMQPLSEASVEGTGDADVVSWPCHCSLKTGRSGDRRNTGMCNEPSHMTDHTAFLVIREF